MKYKVGQEVIFKKWELCGYSERIGRITYACSNWYEIYSEGMDGHTGMGHTTNEYWNVHEKWIKGLAKPKNECIVIYRKDNEVIALDKRTGKKATAKCSPDDEFDFNIGARIAMDRLQGVNGTLRVEINGEELAKAMLQKGV